ncbi:MAG: hypothetical protein ACI9W2_004658 [Gammaproteobacteria bacterium]|jgi:antibiotic biosynthesis monooxygenase (ABM) superfamily enzyme
MSEQAPGLLLVMMEIAPEHEEDFNRWYDEEHVPERMSIPGFVRARRFRALEGTPKYLALYELENVDALDTDLYRHWTGAGQTEWTKRVLGTVSGFVRNVYVEML